MTKAARSFQLDTSRESSRKRRLIFLWTYTIWGGAQIYFFAIIKAARKDWDVLVILPRASKPDLLAFLDQLEVRYEFLDRYFDPKVEPTLVGRIRRQVHRIRAELAVLSHLRQYRLQEMVLHLEVAPWQSWLLLTILALRRANVFATIHNFRPDAPAWRRCIWWIRLQWVSRLPGFHIFASNKDTKENLAGWVSEAFWKDIRVTYTSVDPDQIKTAAEKQIDIVRLREEAGIPADAFVVLAVGQFVDRKGRWVFLEAAKQLLEDVPNAHFAWVMPEEPLAIDRERIGSYALGNHFHPILSRSIGEDRVSILAFFRCADVFVLPSFVEGLPIALLEAMAMGIPSISTSVYAIPEAVINEETGILVEPGDSREIALSIFRLRNDPEFAAAISEKGKEFVIQNFDERVAAASCLEAYQSCFLAEVVR